MLQGQEFSHEQMALMAGWARRTLSTERRDHAASLLSHVPALRASCAEACLDAILSTEISFERKELLWAGVWGLFSSPEVDDARIGVAHNVGGTGGTAVVHVFEREDA